jgi:hypothetical protein
LLHALQLLHDLLKRRPVARNKTTTTEWTAVSDGEGGRMLLHDLLKRRPAAMQESGLQSVTEYMQLSSSSSSREVLGGLPEAPGMLLLLLPAAAAASFCFMRFSSCMICSNDGPQQNTKQTQQNGLQSVTEKAAGCSCMICSNDGLQQHKRVVCSQ